MRQYSLEQYNLKTRWENADKNTKPTRWSSNMINAKSSHSPNQPFFFFFGNFIIIKCSVLLSINFVLTDHISIRWLNCTETLKWENGKQWDNLRCKTYYNAYGLGTGKAPIPIWSQKLSEYMGDHFTHYILLASFQQCKLVVTLHATKILRESLMK